MDQTSVTAVAGGVVIYGPAGCGKTTHAVALAASFGKTRIVDDWQPGGPLPADTLALTSEPCKGAINFNDALRDAGVSRVAASVRSAMPDTKNPVDHLMKAAFCRPRADRSQEYKAGVRALLSNRINGVKLDCPHAAGTAQSDAFWSGADEGRKIWSDVQAHHPQLAIAAAEFKYLLDVQPSGSLFNPGGTGDARASTGYALASGLLAEAVSQSNATDRGAQ